MYGGILLRTTDTEPAVILPNTDEWGFFGIRFESIGGYGANIAGKMLAEACILDMGLGGANFSSYGSEKKGSPVQAFVRLCAPEQQVRTSAPIDEPHLIAVFHDAMLDTLPVTAGLRPDGILLVNTGRTAEAIRRQTGLDHITIGVIDATAIAVAEGSRANTVMLGAVCRALPFLQAASVRQHIATVFGQKYPKSVPGNLAAFDRGARELTLVAGRPAAPGVGAVPLAGKAPRYGYQEAPIGGIIVNPGNSIEKDLSASRVGYLPAFDRAACIDCTRCELACPDHCFVWGEGTDARGQSAPVLLGIDYQYCKGCLKCVTACPTTALSKVLEEPGWAEAHRVALADGYWKEAFLNGRA